MSKIDLLNMLTKQAKEFRKDSDWYYRNRHMHLLETYPPPQAAVDAVLSGFINHIAMGQCVDYALYAEDLNE